MEINSILFVCTGNTARSPAAEYLAKHYAKKLKLNLRISSAGFINAFSYMQPGSRRYLNSKGIAHSDFVPQLVNRKLLEQFDLILTMELHHKRDILSSYSNVKTISGKVYTLKEFNGERSNLDIIDPYYTSDKIYAQVMELIDEQVHKLIQTLQDS